MSGRSAPVLAARGLWKKHAHQLGRAAWYGLRDIGREIVGKGAAGALRPDEFWAVQNVDFEIRRGEALAVLGSNGAGKSTLLKILAGLLKPDRGWVSTAGTSAAIIELGAGVAPLLSGRENVHLAAALHCVPKQDWNSYLERVLDFAELGEFIEAPVQSYSAGMRARLAYAIASQLRPDVMLIDEVLAVGDQAFQRKCMQHIRRYLHNGGALVLVSHNVYQIQGACQRGLVLAAGTPVFAGTAVEAVSRYFETTLAGPDAPGRARAARFGPAEITGIRITGADGGEVRSGGPARVIIAYRAREPLEVICAFGIATADEAVTITSVCERAGRRIEAGEGEIACMVPALPLLPGRYAARASLVERGTHQALALLGYEDEGVPFAVRGGADRFINEQVRHGQLIAVDASWPSDEAEARAAGSGQ